MRTLLGALGILVATLVAADEPPASPPTSPPEQTTTVRGAVPDLVGRWLIVGTIKLPTGKERSVPGFWEVTRKDDQAVLTTRFAKLPAAQQQAVDKADKTEVGWRPTAEDLAAVAAEWSTLRQQDPKIATVGTEVIARDAFDEAMKSESISKDALFVVRQAEVFLPTAAPTLRQVNLYAVTATKPGGYTGNYTLAIVAAAPFPIPISLNGTCELFRLDAPPQGLLARLLDLFRGCGR